MEAYFKKYFWTLGVLVVLICSVFAAKGVNHFLEAKVLGDSAEPAKAPARTTKTTTKKDKKSKVGEPIAKRNMFCSDCEPIEPSAEDLAATTSEGSVPLTSLPLRLVATNISTSEGSSFATIQNTESENKGAFWMKDKIPGGGEIVRIRGKYVDFQNATSKRLERISLLSQKDKPKKTTSTKTAAKSKKPKDELLAMIDEGVKKVDDTNFEIDRDVVNKVLANPASVARGARIVPSIKNGKANGFKLYAIRPSSVYAKIGLMNGDTIHSVNGFELTTPDKALEVYTKVRNSNSLSVTATRRGKPVTLNYSIK
jgi:general secretion pathway protein C